jgi:hypothetical protein
MLGVGENTPLCFFFLPFLFIDHVVTFVLIYSSTLLLVGVKDGGKGGNKFRTIDQSRN